MIIQVATFTVSDHTKWLKQPVPTSPAVHSSTRYLRHIQDPRCLTDSCELPAPPLPTLGMKY